MNLPISTGDPKMTIDEAVERMFDELYFMLEGENIPFRLRQVERCVRAGQLARVWSGWPDFKELLTRVTYESYQNRLINLFGELETTTNPFWVGHLVDEINEVASYYKPLEHFGFSVKELGELAKAAWRRCGPAMLALVERDLREQNSLAVVKNSTEWLIRTIREGFDLDTLSLEDQDLCRWLVGEDIEVQAR